MVIAFFSFYTVYRYFTYGIHLKIRCELVHGFSKITALFVAYLLYVISGRQAPAKQQCISIINVGL